MPHPVRSIALALVLGASSAAAAQHPTAARTDSGTTIDLAARLAAGGVRAVARTASPLADGGRTVVRLDGDSLAMRTSGVAWLDDVAFAEGTLEVELRGTNAPGASFVGVAFHGVNDSTYEAVYVRPFNFGHADSAARAHAVQYVSHPTHTWRRLREAHPGEFEQPIEPAPDPEAWLRLRLVVGDSTVAVHVNGAAVPSLVVRRLTEQRTGRVGLWVGNPSRGDFATLRVVPAGR